MPKIKRYTIGLVDPKKYSLYEVCMDLEKRGITEYEFDKISNLRVGETFSHPELPDVVRVQ